MTDQVSISTTPQGTGLAATAAKAQSGGKGAGFLGMLMAAIGHKSEDTSGAASSLVHTGKDAKKGAGKNLLLANAAAKTIVSNGKKQAAATSLIDAAAGNGKKQAAATSLIGAAAGNGKKQAAATSLIGAAAGNGKKQAAAKADDKSTAAASLIDTAAQVATNGNANVAAHAATKDKASAQSNADQGSANKHAGHKHRNKDSSPSLAAAPIAVAMQQATTPSQADASATHQDNGTDTGSQVASQHTGSKPAHSSALDGALLKNTTAHPSLSPKEKAGMADASAKASTKAPVQDGAEPTDEASTQTKSVQADARTLSTGANTRQATPASGQAGSAATAAMLADAAGQPATDTPIQGRQGKTRGTVENTATTSPQHADAPVSASAQQAQLAKNAITDTAVAHGKAQAHSDADAHPSASHPSGTQGNQDTQASAASAPKPGIHSYARVAAHTLSQATPSAPLSHQVLPTADGHRDAAMAQASAPSQNLSMGASTLTAAPGIGQATQAMPMPQATAPQAPVHASGPWTAMAAMTEIGQAAATGLTRLELKLEPAHLGKVHVRIDSDQNKNIQVHLVVEQPGSCQTIQQQLPNLRHALEQQGLNLGNFSMSSQGQGGGQESGQQAQQPAMASAPGFNAPQAQASQLTNAPSDLPVSGRLSIRV